MKKNFILLIINLCILCGCVSNNNSDNTSSKDDQNNTNESDDKNDNDIIQNNIDSIFTMCEIKTDDLDIFKYYLYTPKNPTKNMPLIVYLHGGSGKGDDLSLITNVEGFPKYLRDGQLGDVNAYVIIPQVPSIKRGWPEIRNSLNYLIDTIVIEYEINKNKVSLTGHSMGGTGTWNIVLKEPTRFYKIAPLSGSIETTQDNIDKLKNLQIWTMVGTEDTIVKPDTTISFIEEIKKVNSMDKITIFDGATHFDVPGLAYLDKELGLIEWLLN